MPFVTHGPLQHGSLAGARFAGLAPSALGAAVCVPGQPNRTQTDREARRHPSLPKKSSSCLASPTNTGCLYREFWRRLALAKPFPPPPPPTMLCWSGLGEGLMVWGMCPTLVRARLGQPQSSPPPPNLDHMQLFSMCTCITDCYDNQKITF